MMVYIFFMDLIKDFTWKSFKFFCSLFFSAKGVQKIQLFSLMLLSHCAFIFISFPAYSRTGVSFIFFKSFSGYSNILKILCNQYFCGFSNQFSKGEI